MAKIKVENGLQRKQVSVEQAQAYEPFGWVPEKNSECVIHKKNMVTVTRREEFATKRRNDKTSDPYENALIKVNKAERDYLRLEKKVCKKKPGLFNVLFFLIGVAIATLEFVDVGFTLSSYFVEYVSFAKWVVVGVAALMVVLCIFCPSGKPKFGKYKKATLKKCQTEMRSLAEKAAYALQYCKEDRRDLMTRKEHNGYEFQTAIERAILREQQEREDEQYIPF